MSKKTITTEIRRDHPPKSRFSIPSSLGLHEILVANPLSVLLPQTPLFRFPTGPVIRQLGLVEQFPQPGRILLVGKSEDGGLVLEVVQSDEGGILGTGGPRACARYAVVSCAIFFVGKPYANFCSPPVGGDPVTVVVGSGTALRAGDVDLDAYKRTWRVRAGCRRTREMNMKEVSDLRA
jgi:hypothetical protein